MILSTSWVLTLFCFCYSYGKEFTNDWAVKLNGENSVAQQLADEMGYDNLGQIQGFPNVYLLRKKEHPSRSKREARHLNEKLNLDPRVVWAEQQEIKIREKRNCNSVNHDYDIGYCFNDELWPKQWYLHDVRNNKNFSQMNMHITPVWDMGYTGKGIVLSVLDDGIEWNHTDLIQNYDDKASWDLNDNDPDPFPRYDPIDSNKHGTRCAGEIAMVANNFKCGVGVAFNSKIGGIRMLDGLLTDIGEGLSLTFNINHIDIFSSSWGPTDDGEKVDAPGRIASEALEKGITKGRKGKGVIYIWAAGNGGMWADNCNCDGYVSSIYTISIGSANQYGQRTYYSETCASTIASTYSSGNNNQEQKISTTHLRNECTTEHSGTSASAPLAAGIVALVLEANPNMTWRDVQHLIIWTAEVLPLIDNKGWKINSAGLMYNSVFGFGLMNAEAMVKSALSWENVPQKTVCNVITYTKLPLPLTSNKSIEIFFRTDGCKNTTNEVNYLEHVQVIVSVDYTLRGALDIYLISPTGTETVLLTRRPKDTSKEGFKNWKFLSLHLWGENPNGVWKLVIRDKSSRNCSGLVRIANLVLHGTKEIPKHMLKGKKVYLNEVLSAIDPDPEYEQQLYVANFSYEKTLEEIILALKQHLLP